MANRTNRYGRQIFFTREEIHQLRRLVEIEIVQLHDQIGELEYFIECSTQPEPFEDDIKDAQSRIAMWEKMIDDQKGKLWYYVDEEQELQK